MIEFYFRGLDEQYGTPEIEFPSFEIEKDNFRVSQGKQMKNRESFESKVLKQKQHCVAAPHSRRRMFQIVFEND